MMSLSSYASSRGLDKSTISRQVNSGVIPHTRDGSRIMIDPDAADAARSKHLNFSKSRKPSLMLDGHDDELTDLQKLRAGQQVDLNAARQIKENYAARTAQLDYMDRVKLLVPTEDVERQGFKAGREVRNRLLALPRDIAGRLALETDERVIIKILREALVGCLIGLADGMGNVEGAHAGSVAEGDPG
ncbi:MAG: hypothetical protein WBK91_04065 [Alphaproteobacteria bacterium]